MPDSRIQDGRGGTGAKVENIFGSEMGNPSLDLSKDAFQTAVGKGHLPGQICHAFALPILYNAPRQLIRLNVHLGLGALQLGQNIVGSNATRLAIQL